MKRIIGLLLLIFSSNMHSQINNCKILKKGVFEIYENGEKIGRIYRKENYQLEDYFDGKDLSKVRIKTDKCKLYFNSYEIENDLDTITWVASYTKKERNLYSFNAKPLYLKIGYTYVGEIKKINDKIRDKQVLVIFKELENNK